MPRKSKKQIIEHEERLYANLFRLACFIAFIAINLADAWSKSYDANFYVSIGLVLMAGGVDPKWLIELVLGRKR